MNALAACALCVTFSAVNSQYLRQVYDLNQMPQERNIILAKHNRLRAREGSSNMQELVWDPDLANSARQWASNCDASHSPSFSRGGGWNWVGENLWWWTGGFPDLSRVVQDLYDEIQYYDYYSGYCSGVCGHYTQVVWANTCAMGCALADCNSLVNGFGVNYGYLVVCQYGPGGNIAGAYPYSRGRTCGSCPAGCSGSLCASTCSGERSFSLPQVQPRPQPSRANALSTTSSCQDLDWECSFFAGRGECNSNPVWMLQNCPSSCNSCGQSSGGGMSQACSDMDFECSHFAAIGECQRNPVWMNGQCPASCNVC